MTYKAANQESQELAQARGDFFAVDFNCWQAACGLGMNAAISYLILARGTGFDNRTTSWSTNAIECRTGISRPRAKAAIASLIGGGLVRLDQGGLRPRYHLFESGEGVVWVWLPNALIDGAANETPPIELLRQSQDVGALRLLVNFYFEQSLQNDCGVHFRKLRLEYAREKVGEAGAFNIWGFAPTHQTAWRSISLVKPFMTGKDTVEGKQDTGWPVFWKSLGVLENDLGLVQLVAHLVEGDTDDSEVLHPCAISEGEPGEQAIGAAAHEAAVALLGEWAGKRALSKSLSLVPVKRHITNVQMMGMARTKYRPHTTATSAWFCPQKWQAKADEYRKYHAFSNAQRTLVAV